MDFFIYCGIALLFVSGLCFGAWTTGSQQRGNFHSEHGKERNIKKKIGTWSALAGALSFAIAGLISLVS
ncbi:DUF5316 family protein [Paenibacillus xylanivorans]|uniref:Protein-export membrane protein SecG n=1 Tax=Paenibacillus xylanivorans TaxID=1705561 RepID=A0A0M9BIK6_9BACL|nr:DUF5316 family protein [Paenibacillus xylanivorans]KOY13018.1 hypothetical protein AMS66_28745 [Paenibacillus xylanivorans]